MYKLTVLLTSLAVSLASVWNMSAQNTEVKGRVTDTAGEPLVAVTVYESGNTSNGTVTDIDGNYTISVPPTATLIFSCLGFEEVQEVVAKRNTINVSLAEEQLSIDAAEVVSIGYGTVSRRDLTGSVSKVDMGDIMKTPVTNFDQALTGRIAGVVDHRRFPFREFHGYIPELCRYRVHRHPEGCLRYGYLWSPRCERCHRDHYQAGCGRQA